MRYLVFSGLGFGLGLGAVGRGGEAGGLSLLEAGIGLGGKVNNCR